MSKAGAARHVNACFGSPARGGGGSAYYLRVEGLDKDYWLDLSVKKSATLDDLDAFLRDVWLECCGHLSAFSVNGRRYESEEHGNTHGGTRSTKAPVGTVLAAGSTAGYEYDFGSTTELRIKVVSEIDVHEPCKAVELLARNNPPKIDCECGIAANCFCVECDSALCAKCAAGHRGCDETMRLPVVNSPRTGVCGYCGPYKE